MQRKESVVLSIYAHSKNDAGDYHLLTTHQESVALKAGQMAKKFGCETIGIYLGKWHDIGKINSEFQESITKIESNIKRPPHAWVGALYASDKLGYLSLPILGHHAGLKSTVDLKNLLKLKEDKLYKRLIFDAENKLNLKSDIDEKELKKILKPFSKNKEDLELLIRMLFSALVDADFLDTENHFLPDRHKLRENGCNMDELWLIFCNNQARLTGKIKTKVNKIRHQIYMNAIEAANYKPGIYSLTVPTGGGKTRTGLGFALKHAINHSFDRVIFAIPYTSIIEQTVDEYKKILGEAPVLEHHSTVTFDESEENETILKHQLASENWDKPIIVTTTVQLFESLFSNRPSKCRKLHNISNSVIILDEVQSLPPRLLTPILDVLQTLVDNYKVTVVLCTATQPSLSKSPDFKGLNNITEIVINPKQYFDTLKRVMYEWDFSRKWKWEEIAQEMRKHKQCMTVVNSKIDALKLYDALGGENAFYLSTLICGNHRRDVLKEIKQRLKDEKPCYLVSTQLIEAGVNIDFPVVLRALAPMDRIVQTAGRCNREGLLKAGKVIIFIPEDENMPEGAYKTGTFITKNMLECGVDLHDPMAYITYFEKLYKNVETDAEKIQELRRMFDYPKVAERFKMIPDTTVPCVVKYDSKAAHLIKQCHKNKLNKELMRSLQPYIVNLEIHKISQLLKSSLIRELSPGLYEWLGHYNPKKGIVVD